MFESAGDKCAATEFAKSGTKSSNLQTNKCTVGVRGQPINDWLFAVSPSLWNSDLISDCLPSTGEFSTDSEGGELRAPAKCKQGAAAASWNVKLARNQTQSCFKDDVG